MLKYLIFLVGLAGAASITYGAWQVNHALAFVVGGVFCLCWSYLAARSVAFHGGSGGAEGAEGDS